METVSGDFTTPAALTKNAAPIPMSFPAILRTSGLNDRFAHLRVGVERSTSSSSVSSLPKKNKRDDKEGKRWIRRKENARFVGNPHIVSATRKDYSIPTPTNRATFPEPLPAYLSRNNPIPPAAIPTREPMSANAGRFSMSLRGMRKELRKSGPRTEQLVKEVEDEIISWLRHGGVLLNPDFNNGEFNFPGSPIGSQESITEVSRTPLKLVWSIRDDAFARYVVHCCARYHNVVSFSKEDLNGHRLTHLLRPNVTRPDYLALRPLETPPTTDTELSGLEFASESDFASDRDTNSETGVDSEVERGGVALSDIAESLPTSPMILPSAPPPPDVLDEAWSVIGGESDIDNEAGDELAYSVESLSLQGQDVEGRRLPRMEVRYRQSPLRTSSANIWERSRRSASSPSRSPARRMPPRAYHATPSNAGGRPAKGTSFYDYLFT
ncbi:hypothetical protein C8Q75DRAFT_263047 [Abortiporus biennis]|nr:hypothetical protein C8Q75DRAFT_263047 [Abortiporus biennis]